MSKRNSDGDVLFNKISVGLAKHQRLLSSWAGLQAEQEKVVELDQQHEELANEIQGPEQLGLGAAIPKDIEDGSFTRRPLTSNDKLREQLLGKKAAKEYRESKLAPRATSNPEKLGRRTAAPKREDSEDEDEGRASAFRSKKAKSNKAPPSKTSAADDVDGSVPAGHGHTGEDVEQSTVASKKPGKVSDGIQSEETTLNSRIVKPKPGSYLDQILAERSKKKKKKKKGSKGTTAA